MGKKGSSLIGCQHDDGFSSALQMPFIHKRSINRRLSAEARHS
ncbi:hypothetical protein SynPROS91_01550 [Synechococcus sp. PROS-9-1]|nr:hypothetical protein SynPROS91_01550 [Synechococcus sp. PROS-9-1]